MHRRSICKASDETDCGKQSAFVSDRENAILSMVNTPAGSGPTPVWAKVGLLLFEGHFS